MGPMLAPWTLLSGLPIEYVTSRLIYRTADNISEIGRYDTYIISSKYDLRYLRRDTKYVDYLL